MPLNFAFDRAIGFPAVRVSPKTGVIGPGLRAIFRENSEDLKLATLVATIAGNWSSALLIYSHIIIIVIFTIFYNHHCFLVSCWSLENMALV